MTGFKTCRIMSRVFTVPLGWEGTVLSPLRTRDREKDGRGDIIGCHGH